MMNKEAVLNIIDKIYFLADEASQLSYETIKKELEKHISEQKAEIPEMLYLAE